jgi:preprotein translocase subunit SecB
VPPFKSKFCGLSDGVFRFVLAVTVSAQFERKLFFMCEIYSTLRFKSANWGIKFKKAASLRFAEFISLLVCKIFFKSPLQVAPPVSAH